MPKITVNVEPWGPTMAEMLRLAEELPSEPPLARVLSKRWRRLYIKPVYVHNKNARILQPPTRFHAVYFDYDNNRALLVGGNLEGSRDVEVLELEHEPLPTWDEFQEAVALLSKDDSDVGRGLAGGRYTAYRPMPPLLPSPQGEKQERIIAVGLLLKETKSLDYLIAGVNLVNRRLVTTVKKKALKATSTPCGHKVATQPTEDGAAGAAWITVSVDGNPIWRFLALRPAATGTDGYFPNDLGDGSPACRGGGGVEIWNVDYRGARVLGRAHVPILNVKYIGADRGPFRDWNHKEGYFYANGDPRGDGFIQCSAADRPQTIVDTGIDAGNFRGVAVYVDGQEAVLVSELEAGEYRYKSEWRFHVDGTIRPRFGFTVIDVPAICPLHVHHAFWRFDFDVQTKSDNIVRQFTPLFPRWFKQLFFFLKPLFDWLEWKKFSVEQRCDMSPGRYWQILNATNREGYELVPGHHDMPAAQCPDWNDPNETDPNFRYFPEGDVWILRYRNDEVDDRRIPQTTNATAPSNIGQFLTNESIERQDVVIWYGGHIHHNPTQDPETGHTVGPTLRPTKKTTSPAGPGIDVLVEPVE